MGEHYILEAALEGVEGIADAFTENEILKDIPVVGIAAKALKAAGDIRDRAFAAKITRFVQALDEITPEAREKIRQRIAANPEEAQQVGETLFLVLEKITALDKAKILAYLFVAYTMGRVGPVDFRRMADIIDQAFIDDLEGLLNARQTGHNTHTEYMKHLTRTGLTFADPTRIPRPPEDHNYKVSRLGRQFISAYDEAAKYCRHQ